MEIKKIAALLDKVRDKKSSISIIQYAFYQNGTLTVTDNTNWITIETGEFHDGPFMVDINLLKKTGHLQLSKVNVPTEDFPEYKAQKGSGIPLPVNLFNGGLSKFEKYCMPGNMSRLVLEAVHISHKNSEMVATNGAILRLDTDCATPVDLNIPSKLLKIIDSIPVDKAEAKGNYCELSGGGVYFAFQQVEGPYPDYRQAIPKEDNNGHWLQCGNINEILLALEALKPFTDKTNLVFFDGDRIYSLNREKGCCHYVRLSQKFFVKDEENLRIGFNIDILCEILASLASEAWLHYSTNIGAVTLSCADELFLIMPLRILAFDKEIIMEAAKKEIETWMKNAQRVEEKQTPKAQKATIDPRVKKIIMNLQKEIGVDNLLEFLNNGNKKPEKPVSVTDLRKVNHNILRR